MNFFGSALHAEVASTYVLCKHQSYVRTVRLKEVDLGCKVIYTKEGQDRQVGAARQKENCLVIVNNIRANLQKAGWKCHEAKNASFLESQKDADE